MSLPAKPIHLESINESFLARFHSKYIKGTLTECWEWFGTINNVTNYGAISTVIPSKGNYSAHRIMWFVTHNNVDPIPLQVLHTCDNRICVNPNHLFLGTIQDNNADKTTKGRARNGSTILTEQQVEEILTELASEAAPTQQELANKYGVSRPTISHIAEKTHWKHLSKDIKIPKWGVRLNENMVIEIKAKFNNGESVANLAIEYNVDRHSISNIIHGRTWKC